MSIAVCTRQRRQQDGSPRCLGLYRSSPPDDRHLHVVLLGQGKSPAHVILHLARIRLSAGQLHVIENDKTVWQDIGPKGCTSPSPRSLLCLLACKAEAPRRAIAGRVRLVAPYVDRPAPAFAIVSGTYLVNRWTFQPGLSWVQLVPARRAGGFVVRTDHNGKMLNLVSRTF